MVTAAASTTHYDTAGNLHDVEAGTRVSLEVVPLTGYAVSRVACNYTIDGNPYVDELEHDAASPTMYFLCDGARLTAGDGVYIKKGSSLSIYGQNAGTGKLIAKPDSGPGIGGMADTVAGSLYIHGGDIDAEGGTNAAGIISGVTGEVPQIVSDSNKYIVSYGSGDSKLYLGLAPTYAVTVAGDIEHGMVTADPVSGNAGDTVTLTAEAEEDYILADLTVTPEGGEAEAWCAAYDNCVFAAE